MTYTELYPKLIKSQFIQSIPTKLMESPYRRWCNPNVTCLCHDSATGNGIKNCLALRCVVQKLIEPKWFDFSDELSVTHKPLPLYQAGPMSMIEEYHFIKKLVDDITTLLEFIYSWLVKEWAIIGMPLFEHKEDKNGK